MTVEPTIAEYDALADGLIRRVRRNGRRRRAARLIVVACSAAMLGAAATAGLGWAGANGGAEADNAIAGVADGGTAEIVCLAAPERTGDRVTIRRAGDAPGVAAAVGQCERVWSLGLLDSRPGVESAPRSDELAVGDDKAVPQSVPGEEALRGCRLADGSIAVVPDPEARGDALCSSLQEGDAR